MKARRDEGIRRRNQVREARWREHRLAVPYPTDGPKVTLGVIWAVAVVGGAWLSTLLLAVVVVAVAALAGLQAGHVFGPPIDRRATAAAAAIVGACGLGGALGAGVGVVVGVGGIAAYVAGTLPEQKRGDPRSPNKPSRAGSPGSTPSHRDVVIGVTEMMVRSSIPAGVAAASLIAIGKLEFSGLLALVILVSAYEAGDFLIGTGSANSVEGPVAGIVALIVASAGLYLVLPPPFSTDNFPLFVLLTAAAAPLGQIAASAVLPRGDSWAPALRRLDSYLLAAPLWLLLLPRI